MKRIGIFLMAFILASVGMQAKTEKTSIPVSSVEVFYNFGQASDWDAASQTLTATDANSSFGIRNLNYSVSDYDRLVVKYTFVGARPWYAHLRVDNGDEPFYEEDTNGELDTEHTATISLASGLTSNQDGKDLAAITTIGRIYFFIMGDGKVKINEIYLEKDVEDTPDTPSDQDASLFTLTAGGVNTTIWGDNNGYDATTKTITIGADGNAVGWTYDPAKNLSDYKKLVIELQEALGFYPQLRFSSATAKATGQSVHYIGLPSDQTKIEIDLTAAQFTYDGAEGATVALDLTDITGIYFWAWAGEQQIKLNKVYLEKDAEDTPDTPDTPTTGDFAITIDDMVNGAVTANAESANEGTAIALTVTPAAGYKLKDLRIEVLASPEDADVIFSNARRRAPENMPAVGEFIKATLQADGTYTFTMPAHDVLVSALFKEKPLEPTLNYDKPTRTITLTNSEYSIDGTLHYTLNGAAEQTSTEETVAVVITENTTVVAWITDGDTSDEVTETFNVAAIPTISYTDGENTVALTLTAATAANTADATLYYTTDGSEPTTSSPSLTANASIDITKDMTTIKVMALDADGNYSETVTQAVVYARYLTIGKEWATFYSPETFTLPEGVEAYTISGVNAPADGESGTVTLKEQTVIAKNTPMMIHNTQAATTTKFRVYTTDDAEISASDMCSEFKGASESTTFTDDGNIRYILTNGVFLRSKTGTLPAYNCYLEFSAGSPAAGARRFSMVIGGGETTGIDTIGTATLSDGQWYNLNGVRVAQPAAKGVYVKNGKKVVVK